MNYPAPFSENQSAFFWRCFDNWFNVAEGGKRGGKNVLITMAYCAILEKHPSKLHLVAGVSTTTARLNILDCDGYGVSNYFEGRCREGQYKNRDCLYVNTPTGEKIILVSGGGKDRDERLIKGNTYGTAYITEANECHPNFIKEVFDRTISSPDRKVFHDLNPKAPGHWYYEDVIGFHEQQQLTDPDYGYNYGHFDISDNMSISDAQLRKILKTYDKNSVWYKRDILGQRCPADGLVYQYFADHTDEFLIDDPLKWCEKNGHRITTVMIGVDFGGTGSANKFQATGITGRGTVIALDEEYIKRDIDPDALNKAFSLFVQRVSAVYGASQTRADSAEQILIRGLTHTVQKDRLRTTVKNAIKGEINNRIRLSILLMAQKRFYISRKCPHLVSALQTAVYDPKKMDDTRLDDGTSDIDSLDAFEYSIEPWAKQLEAAGFRR
jgi:PBSX family phage terminase large subunit